MRQDYSESIKEIGRAIAKYRQTAGLTQAQVAELLNISNDAVSRMERGIIVPSAMRLLELADIFQCDVASLLGDGSFLMGDQARRIMRLLTGLEERERLQLLEIVEAMVLWYHKRK
ncbi:helix-turn-helix domain-containing protein [Rappaport israeli]|uniref:helix-turn-helix domain-containing protein n=1 Tax=Rappaport israeli TaxID=1839807 RepID=UPI000931F663|nr:helix-turn-helix transcriptional regulator [Rappaport israeli]